MLTDEFPSKIPYSWAKYWTIGGNSVTIVAKFRGEEILPNPGFELHHPKSWEEETPKFGLVVSTHCDFQTHQIAKNVRLKGQSEHWIFDWHSTIFSSSSFPWDFFQKRREKSLLRAADTIVGLGSAEATRLATLYGHQKVFTLEEGFDTLEPHQINSEPIFPDDGKFRIFFSGENPTHGRLEIFFQAIQAIHQDPFLKYLLKGLEVIYVENAMDELATRYHCEPWIRSIGSRNGDKVTRALRDAHAILYFPDGEGSNQNLLEILYTRTPVIALGEVGSEHFSERMLLKTGAGHVVHTLDEIHEYLVKELTNIRKSLTKIDPSFLKRYSHKAQALRLLEFVS